jgi:hypothetical protein
MSTGDLALAIMELNERLSAMEREVAALKSAERRKTVRAKRPVKQRKAKIWLCEATSKCEHKGLGTVCKFSGGCPAQRQTSAVA